LSAFLSSVLSPVLVAPSLPGLGLSLVPYSLCALCLCSLVSALLVAWLAHLLSLLCALCSLSGSWILFSASLTSLFSLLFVRRLRLLFSARFLLSLVRLVSRLFLLFPPRLLPRADFFLSLNSYFCAPHNLFVLTYYFCPPTWWGFSSRVRFPPCGGMSASFFRAQK